MSATTPRKTAMSSHNNASQSLGRRVLGDLTPRAINTPSKQTNRSETYDEMRARSPLKQVQTASPLYSADKENALNTVASMAGRKRSIHEVEEGAHASKPFAGRDMHMPPSKVRVTDETTGGVALQHQRSRGSTTEPDSPPPELTFETMPVSQQTTDSQRSFSNFVDWAECDSSQPSDQTVTSTAPVPTKPSRADLLRLRLGLAGYKVKTNQVEKSGSEIISTWEETTSPPSKSNAIPSITLSKPVPHDAPIHIKANLDPGHPIPKLSAGPVLLPTPFSSRLIEMSQVPSSPPPPADALPKCVSPEMVMSPTRGDYRTPAAKRIRKADYENDVEEGDEEEEEEEEGTEDMTVQERLQHLREKGDGLGDLTSSVVKGHAAMGLLELNSGRR